MGKESQHKGANGERELAIKLEQAGFPVTWGGNKTYGAVPDLSGLHGIHVECKRVERLNTHAAMKQAQEDSKRFHDGFPAVFQKREGEEWLVTMLLPQWLEVYGGWRTSLQLGMKPRPTKDEIHEKLIEKERIRLRPNYWEKETPKIVDTGRNVLEYYPEGGVLAVRRPNWMDSAGNIKRGKTVGLDLDAICRSPEAIQIMLDIADTLKVYATNLPVKDMEPAQEV